MVTRRKIPAVIVFVFAFASLLGSRYNYDIEKPAQKERPGMIDPTPPKAESQVPPENRPLPPEILTEEERITAHDRCPVFIDQPEDVRTQEEALLGEKVVQDHVIQGKLSSTEERLVREMEGSTLPGEEPVSQGATLSLTPEQRAGQVAAECPAPLLEQQTNDLPNYPGGFDAPPDASAAGGNTLGGGVAGIAGGGASGASGGGGSATTGGLKR